MQVINGLLEEVSYFFLFLLILNSINTHNHCNGGCFQKVYKLSMMSRTSVVRNTHKQLQHISPSFNSVLPRFTFSNIASVVYV